MKTTTSDIVSSLRDDILSGRRKPGDFLRETNLAEEFKVSRGPVRDALKALIDMGIASFTPHLGASVRNISREDAKVIYELRIILEVGAAQLAAKRVAVNPQSATSLAEMLSTHENEVRNHRVHAYLQLQKDNDFHLAIARMSGNPMIENLLANELYPQIALLRQCHQNVEGRGERALREHRQIGDALAQGDDQLSGLLMRRHLENSWASLQSRL